MRNRISRVVTRTGDRGETSLAGPERLPKHHPRLELIGALDEANSFIGLLAARISEQHEPALTRIQSRLFDIGGAVAIGGTNVDWQPLVAEIEAETRSLNKELPPLRDERAFWAEAENLSALVDAGAGAYLNRLSDYLFVLARTAARENGVAEVVWAPLDRH